MERVHIKDVVAILIKDPNVIREKQDLFLELGLCQADFQQPDNLYTMGAITTKDLFFGMLSKWMSAKKKPSLTTFLDVVEKCGFVNAADSIREAFQTYAALELVSSGSGTVQPIEEPANKSMGTCNRNDAINKPPNFCHQYQGVVAGFIPREELQNEILAHLQLPSSNETKFTFPLVNLNGFGGNGKSQLARKIVQICEKSNLFDGNSIWISALTESSIIDGFKNFGEIEKEIADSDISFFMKKIYEKLKPINYLLIFDDCDDFEMLQKYLPMNFRDANVKVIVTSHLEWDTLDKSVKNISVGTFTVNEFCNFVGTSLEYEITKYDLALLASYTGRIPANTSLVCKGIAQSRKNNSTYSITHHLKKYGKRLFRFSSEEKSNVIPGLKESDYRKSTTVVVKQQIACMKENQTPELFDLSMVILNCLTYCDTVISEKYFLQMHPGIRQQLNYSDENTFEELNQAIGLLNRFGWIEIISNDRDCFHCSKLSKSSKQNLNSSGYKSSIQPVLQKYSIHNCYQICLRDLQKEIVLEQDSLVGMIEYVKFVKETPFVELDNDQCLSFTKNSMWSTFCSSCLVKECETHFKIFWPIIKEEQNFEQLKNYICTGHGVIQTLAQLNYFSELEILIDEWEDKEDLGQALLQTRNVLYNRSAFWCIALNKNHNFATKCLEIVGNYYDNLNTEEQAKVGCEFFEICRSFVWNGDVKNFEMMFKRFKIDVNTLVDGWTFLHSAARGNKLEMIDLLISLGADIEAKVEYNGCTPLMLAAQYGHLEIVKCLIEHDSNLNEQDNMGDTPLHCAMVLENQYFSSWKKTIEKKLNDLKESKRTYLKDNDEVVKHLIENGANVNVQNNQGYTPLYLAVVLERFKSAQLLFDAGADVNIKDNEEKSLLTTVIGSGHKTALEFLEKNNGC